MKNEALEFKASLQTCLDGFLANEPREDEIRDGMFMFVLSHDRGDRPVNEERVSDFGKKKAPDDCSMRCYYATGRRCKCRCGGRHHGVGWKKITIPYEYEIIRDPHIISLFYGATCIVCKQPLKGAPVLGYSHSEGFELNGRKLWVFAICPSCGYQLSLSKIVWKLAEGSSNPLGFLGKLLRSRESGP